MEKQINIAMLMKKSKGLTFQDKILIGYGFKVILDSIESILGRKLTKKELKEIKEKYAKGLSKGNIIK